MAEGQQDVPRTAVVVKIDGKANLMPVGTEWKVARVTTHYEPGGIVGETDPEHTIIEFHPHDASEPAEGDAQRRCWTILGPEPISQCVLYNGHEGQHQFSEQDVPRTNEPDDDGCGFVGTFMGVEQRCDEPPYSDWHNPSSRWFKHAYEHDCGECTVAAAGQREAALDVRLPLRDELAGVEHEVAERLHRYLWGEVPHQMEPDDGSDCQVCYDEAAGLLYYTIAPAVEAEYRLATPPAGEEVTDG